ncbi:peptidase family M20/M25/M40 protein [Colletotrichum navitas]|uniref:Peptidase family M20/M25/M40 protein n=1 Tax=Colletotrichum navitas TaxID=681940 RepID=A0AAD8Q617_9PEZI|nr:peptidase family M20/M25/M40 protein [Colletotrichum navitas]KAK1596304.1 peptidase family M20/M25/M40 protein [Colletotrichum navitas]
MADVEPSSPNVTTFAETLQYRATQSRRARPANVQTETAAPASSSTRIPLRPENRLDKRDSRTGLKTIFGRAKSVREVDPTKSYFDTGRGSGLRASLAGISNWSHMRSDLALSGNHSRSTSISANASSTDLSLKTRPTTSDKTRPNNAPAARSSRGSLATWDPPPLFQAYPQAIKHAQLLAATTSADVILRLTDRKGSISLRGAPTQLALTPEPAEEHAARVAERARRKHLRTLSTVKLEWTSKTYVLCTSGYLLQYAADGSFDRLPEKVLHLSKDSAAFVSDAIPGKHWVLQVSSAMESNGLTATDSRSLLARLPFRASDKRHAANFLMVFDSAEEMESWIAVLRREIEALGGKKNLSETGRPRPDGRIAQLRIQPSQRTLVVRDPNRFSRVLPPDFSLKMEQVRLREDEPRSVTDADTTRDPSIDDVSTTNSIISHDGHQLDSLRDSTNRLSHISSGQRTFLTSAGSSPACSPVRDSFASSHFEDLPPPVREPSTVRPRPNAAAILDRRQSLQTLGYSELRASPMSRPPSTYTEADFAHVAINFSIPTSRRSSAVRSPPSSPEQARNRDSVIRNARKPPPTTLAMARPLSIVADQPSPVHGLEPVAGQAAGVSRTRESQGHRTSVSDVSNAYPPRQTSLGPKNKTVTVTLRTSPRKYASSPSLQDETPVSPELRTFILPSKTPSPASSCEVRLQDSSPRPLSSSGTWSRAQAVAKRLSAPSLASRSPGDDMIPPPPPPLRVVSASLASSSRAPTTSPAPWSKQVPCNDHSHGGMGRSSMPALVEGPPPAPPPNYALPPIPQKPHSNA